MGVTIVNGGTQGLGEAIARKLTADGADGLVLAGRSADRGEALAGELTDSGTPTEFVEADALDETTPERVVGAALDRFDTVSGLVNVAALTTRANIFSDTREHVERMFSINVYGPYFMIQATARAMVERGVAGSIVNIGSVAGHGGHPKLAAYSMSKGALTIMTRNLAYSLMRHRIRVNQVNPGWMDTENEHHIQLEEDGAPANWLEIAEAGRPLGRIVKPWEVANLVAFCLSDDSGMLTGNCIDVEQAVLGAGEASIPGRDETPMP